MKFLRATPCHITNNNFITIIIIIAPKLRLQVDINETKANKKLGIIK